MTKRTRAAAALAVAVSSTSTAAAAAPLRVAVVGAGSIGREFALHHFGPETGTTVASIVDLDIGLAQRLASDVGSVRAGARLGGPSRYQATVDGPKGEPVASSTSLDKATLAACDLVYVGTTPSSHRELVRSALTAGKHVLLEKPLAATAADADAICADADAALSRGVVLGMNIGMRYNPALREMRRLALEENALGALRGGHLKLHFLQWPRHWQTVAWCASRAQGGPLREVGTHFMFAMCELFGHGAVTRVRATVSYPDGADGVAAETSVEGDLEVQGGLRLSLSISTDGSGLCAGDGRDHYELGVEGERGSLLLDGFTTLRRIGGPFFRRGTLVRDGSYGRRECVASLLAAVAACGGGSVADTTAAGGGDGGSGDYDEASAAAASSAELLITAREGRNAQRLVDAICASNGEWVEVSYD